MNSKLLTTIEMVSCYMNHDTGRSMLTRFDVFQYEMSTNNSKALTHWVVS